MNENESLRKVRHRILPTVANSEKSAFFVSLLLNSNFVYSIGRLHSLSIIIDDTVCPIFASTAAGEGQRCINVAEKIRYRARLAELRR